MYTAINDFIKDWEYESEATLKMLNNIADESLNKKENEKVITEVKDSLIYLRVKVMKGGQCQFSYSFEGKDFKNIDEKFMAREGRWIGAKVGLFCTRESQTNDSGYADFDWFRVSSLP